MRVEVSDPSLVPALVEFFTDRDAYVGVPEAGVLDVGFVGSLNTEQQVVRLEQLVRQWMADHPGVIVVVTAR
jgi:hypothetical protein